MTHAVDFLAPGILALAVMSTAMVSLGIATGFERQYGVLKRLGATPLGRPRLLGAKIASVAAVEIVQVALIVVDRPAPRAGIPGARPGWLCLLSCSATVAFAGLGLLMAGTLRAEVTLAAANGLYLLLLLLGGMVFPLSKLPGRSARPSPRPCPPGPCPTPCTERSPAGGAVPGRAWVVLAVWARGRPAGRGLDVPLGVDA